MSPAPEATMTVNFATADGSATSVDDYIAASGSLVFTAGQTSKTVSVSVKGDKKREAYETFYVQLSGGTGTFLADSQGLGEIRNDDR